MEDELDPKKEIKGHLVAAIQGESSEKNLKSAKTKSQKYLDSGLVTLEELQKIPEELRKEPLNLQKDSEVEERREDVIKDFLSFLERIK